MDALARWYNDGELKFALGLEDTFVPQVRTGERALDEYELTQHYARWHEDLSLVAESGATMLRWGIPWYRINPDRGVWKFDWLDRVVDRADELGIELIVDLMHYGTPLWLENEFLHHDYPSRVAEYAARVGERYSGRLHHFTPMNEPLLNVMYCGEFAHWPPYLRGDDGIIRMIRAVTRGIVLTQRALAEVADDADFVHVEASFRFGGAVEEFAEEVAHLRERAFVIEDLLTGRVDSSHALFEYLRTNGFTDNDFAWAAENVAFPDVMGVNYYPGGQTELFVSGKKYTGGPRDLRPRRNDWTMGLEEVLRAWHDRYGVPVMLTETCHPGSDEEREAWLRDSIATVRSLRGGGVNVVGYTWWSVIDMVEWSYRHGIEPARNYLIPMGLWRLEEDEIGQFNRVRTPLADEFRKFAIGSGRV